MIIRKLIYNSLSFFIGAVALAQQPLQYSKTNATGDFSSERLTRIDNTIKQYIDSGWIKNAIGFIAENGTIVYHKAFGTDGSSSIKKDAIFRIASQTKAITSVAAMILFEEGKFLLDDPISKYLPAFAHMQVLDKFNDRDSTYTTIPAKREITVRDLFTHLSGFVYPGDGNAGMKYVYGKAGMQVGFVAQPIVLSDMMNKLATLPLVHSPGERFSYGLSVDVLGFLVEKISGMSLSDFFQKRIFDPLGMKDTYFYLPPAKYPRLVQLNTENDQHQAIPWKYKAGPGELDYDYPKVKGTYYSGGAGLSSTIYDYAIFMQMLLNHGTYNGHRILSRRSIEMMTSNQIGDLMVGGVDKFGLGFEVVTAQGQAKTSLTEGSFLWGGYFGTSYWIDPQKKLVCLLFLQQVPLTHGEIHDKFRVLVYQALNN